MSEADKKREAVVCVAVGTKGTGKTYTTFWKTLMPYAQNRGVLIFDINNEYTTKNGFPKIKTLLYNAAEPNEAKRVEEIKRLVDNQKKGVVGIRKVLPYLPKKEPTPMSEQQKLQCLFDLLKYYANGMLVVDDVLS